jgi:2-polyprenyl-3-methyl-5-hydroxy-6-metoxy-1,4-benzoquinol methylase
MTPGQRFAAFLCPACGKPLAFEGERRTCCDSARGSRLEEGVVLYDPQLLSEAPAEMLRRDAQASGYLQHSKLPTQIDRMRRFVRRQLPGGLVLDLGCGPGPTTAMLADAGYDVVAVDFSRASLEINRQSCPEAAFVQADLTALRFAGEVANGLMMADFLQHLPGAEYREEFLRRTFAALKPGGWFFLSFFNINVVNWLKGDIHGAFAEGTIRYTRLPAQEVRRALPPNIEVASEQPMNIVGNPAADRLASRLPFARLLSRMTILTGYAR